MSGKRETMASLEAKLVELYEIVTRQTDRAIKFAELVDHLQRDVIALRRELKLPPFITHTKH
jgi:hypothetical protein